MVLQAKEELQTADSFTSAKSGTSPSKQRLSERITAPGGVLSCLLTPRKTAAAADGEQNVTPGLTPRAEASAAEQAAEAERYEYKKITETKGCRKLA